MLTIVTRVNEDTCALLNRSSKYYYVTVSKILQNIVVQAMHKGKIDKSRTLYEPLADRNKVIRFRCTRQFKDDWLKFMYSINVNNEQYAIRCIIDSAPRAITPTGEVVLEL